MAEGFLFTDAESTPFSIGMFFSLRLWKQKRRYARRTEGSAPLTL